MTWVDFWSHIRPMNVSREYASNFRPSATFEYLLLRAAEVGQVTTLERILRVYDCFFQAAGLVYVLSFIFKRSPVNYLYRHPSMFDRSLCLLLVSAISLRTVSQVRTSPEVCARSMRSFQADRACLDLGCMFVLQLHSSNRCLSYGGSANSAAEG